MSTASTPDTLQTLEVDGATYHYHSLPKAAEALGDIDRLPMTLKILLENQLRFADDESVSREDMQALVDWQQDAKPDAGSRIIPGRAIWRETGRVASGGAVRSGLFNSRVSPVPKAEHEGERETAHSPQTR